MFLVCVYKLLYSIDLTFIIIKISAEAHLLRIEVVLGRDELIGGKGERIKMLCGMFVNGRFSLIKGLGKIWEKKDIDIEESIIRCLNIGSNIFSYESVL